MENADPSENLGQSVCDAYEFIDDFERDCRSLLQTLNVLLNENGWTRIKCSKFGAERLPPNYYSLYVPSKNAADENFDSALFLQMRLTRTDLLDEPQLLVVICKFEAGTGAPSLYDKWTKEAGLCLMTRLRKRGGKALLSAQEVNPDFAGNATGAIGIAVSICALKSREMLNTQVVGPILQLAMEHDAASNRR